jgi:hypothetical protein
VFKVPNVQMEKLPLLGKDNKKNARVWEVVEYGDTEGGSGVDEVDMDGWEIFPGAKEEQGSSRKKQKLRV